MQLSQLTRAMFRSYDSGKIIAGIKWSIRTDLGLETHECYQFNSLPELLTTARAFCAIDGMKSIKVVTHKGQYQGMKTLWTWTKEAI